MEARQMRLKRSISQNVLGVVNGLESLGGLMPRLGQWYSRVFYGSMIQREAAQAGLAPGSRVVHVGCGRFPMTALALAGLGFEVLAVDHDPQAVATAKKVVSKSQYSSQIQVELADGRGVQYSDYEAVWVSLHVEPKDEILLEAWKGLKVGGRLIYRNPRGWLRLFYPSTKMPVGEVDRERHRLGKETILVVKRDVPQGAISLEDLPMERPGILLSVPDLSLLSPLGLRPGKIVKVSSRGFMGGPLLLQVEGRTVALARGLARQILLVGGDEHGADCQTSH